MPDDLHKGANYLDKAVHAFRGADTIFLKKIVNDSIRDASLASDKRLAEIAVIAYALMKILHTKYGESRFRLLVNMVRDMGEGREVYRKLSTAADRFLNISIDYIGYIY